MLEVLSLASTSVRGLFAEEDHILRTRGVGTHPWMDGAIRDRGRGTWIRRHLVDTDLGKGVNVKMTRRSYLWLACR